MHVYSDRKIIFDYVKCEKRVFNDHQVFYMLKERLERAVHVKEIVKKHFNFLSNKKLTDTKFIAYDNQVENSKLHYIFYKHITNKYIQYLNEIDKQTFIIDGILEGNKNMFYAYAEMKMKENKRDDALNALSKVINEYESYITNDNVLSCNHKIVEENIVSIPDNDNIKDINIINSDLNNINNTNNLNSKNKDEDILGIKKFKENIDNKIDSSKTNHNDSNLQDKSVSSCIKNNMVDKDVYSKSVVLKCSIIKNKKTFQEGIEKLKKSAFVKKRAEKEQPKEFEKENISEKSKDESDILQLYFLYANYLEQNKQTILAIYYYYMSFEYNYVSIPRFIHLINTIETFKYVDISNVDSKKIIDIDFLLKKDKLDTDKILSYILHGIKKRNILHLFINYYQHLLTNYKNEFIKILINMMLFKYNNLIYKTMILIDKKTGFNIDLEHPLNCIDIPHNSSNLFDSKKYIIDISRFVKILHHIGQYDCSKLKGSKISLRKILNLPQNDNKINNKINYTDKIENTINACSKIKETGKTKKGDKDVFKLIKSNKIGLPGHPTNEIYIEDILDEVHVYSSLQRPKRMCIIGSDGKKYHYIVKAKDDLRRDSRFMDVNELINKILMEDTNTNNSNLNRNLINENNLNSKTKNTYQKSILTYMVIPFTKNSGILEFIPDLVTLKQIATTFDLTHFNKEEKDSSALFKTDKETDILNGKAKYKEECYNTALKYAQKYYKKRKFDKHSLLTLYDLFKHNVNMKDYMFYLCKDKNIAEVHAAIKRYTKTYATMAVVGWIMGLGDRHLENILINKNLEVVHVDLNLLFNLNQLLTIPEKVPFRLTPIVIDGFSSLEEFRHMFNEILGKLCKHKDTIISNLLSFAYDPIITQNLNSKKTGNLIENTTKCTNDIFNINNTIDNMHINNNLNSKNILKEIAKKLEDKDVVERGNKVIDEAMSIDNLSEMYVGWYAFI